MILITHDLAVVAGMADHVIVMYAGRVFESAPARELFRNPQNPYTRSLLGCTPDPAQRVPPSHDSRRPAGPSAARTEPVPVLPTGARKPSTAAGMSFPHIIQWARITRRYVG